MADKVRYRDLATYIEAKGLKKYAVAEDLLVSRFQMSALLHPERYGIVVDDDLAARIAILLNQTVTYVRKLYPRKAAA